jgi:microcystin degradation protein MlrC
LLLARKLADELADGLWVRRREFLGELIDMNTALDRVTTWEGPIGLLDMGDNVGGGAPGDGTILARAIQERRMGPALVCLYDPAAVEQSNAVGVGARLRLRAGGKSDRRHGEPIDGDFTVLGIYDGRYQEKQPRHGGFRAIDQGQTAVVQSTADLTLMLTSRRSPPFSLGQLTSCNLRPESFRLLVIKGVHAPVAAYQHVCRHLIHVNTPGVTTADIKQLEYQQRRRPMFPFEDTTAYEA